MTYKLTSHTLWYGTRQTPFTLLAESGREEEAGIPLEIESAADLDLKAIADELNIVAFNRMPRRAGRSTKRRIEIAADNWQLEVQETTPEKAAELNEQLKADGLEQYGPFSPQIYIAGNGISLRYELQD